MCYERRRAEACVDESAHHALGPVRNQVQHPVLCLGIFEVEKYFSSFLICSVPEEKVVVTSSGT